MSCMPVNAHHSRVFSLFSSSSIFRPSATAAMEAATAPAQPLRIFFFPFTTTGHMIPMIHMASFFSSLGVQSTIIATATNYSFLRHRLSPPSSSQVQLLLLEPPPSPQDTEDRDKMPASRNMTHFAFTCLRSLRSPFRQLLLAHRPDCVVSDMFLPWTYAITDELHIPRVVFHGFGVFSLSLMHEIDRRFQNVGVESTGASEHESIVLPGLPDRIEMMISELPDFVRSPSEISEVMEEVWNADDGSYGAFINSFWELESGYFEHYRKGIGKKAWGVGPLFLASRLEPCAMGIGLQALSELASWLDSNRPDSVLFLCFGSSSEFTKAQLDEMAACLVVSDHPFVLAVGKASHREESESTVFTTILKDHVIKTTLVPADHRSDVGTTTISSVLSGDGALKGMVVEGWAPQVDILRHPAVGGFVTHCGWNSVLEAVCGGVPMVAWPLAADQFYNEKLVVDVLGIGISVGTRTWTPWPEERPLIPADVVGKAVDQVMKREDNDMRRKVRALGEEGRRAVEEGGSSWRSLESFMEELVGRRKSNCSSQNRC